MNFRSVLLRPIVQEQVRRKYLLKQWSALIPVSYSQLGFNIVQQTSTTHNPVNGAVFILYVRPSFNTPYLVDKWLAVHNVFVTVY